MIIIIIINLFWELKNLKEKHTRFFSKQRFFPTQPQCCLTYSWIELQMLLRFCLIHITTIIPKYFLYLLYVCLCLELGLFMTNYMIYFLFSFSCSLRLIAWILTHLFFCLFFRICPIFFSDDNVDEECE